MSNTKAYQTGIEHAKKALAFDNDKKYQEAIKEYGDAIQHFMHVVKWEKNEALAGTVKEKMMGYFNRAEELKKFVKEEEEKAKNPPKKAAAAGGGDGDEDELRSALDDIVKIEKSNIKWSDVAGLEQAKEALHEAVILPIKMPFLFTGKREAWKGILLFGPPGTGKSYIAQAIANEADNSTFMAVSSSDLVSKWQGQSERLVKMMFKMAREKAPSIVFVDEIDSLCGQRGEGESESSRRIKTEFLVQMSGVTPKDGERILVLGATNTPWSLDQAMRRRFEKKIYIPLPDEEARLVMFKIHIGKKTRHTLTDADMRTLAQRAHMRSGADIKILCKDALFAPVRRLSAATHFCPVNDVDRDDPEGKTMRNYWTPCSPGAPGAVEKGWSDFADPEREIIENPVSMRDMMVALEHTKAMTTPEDLIELDKWQKEFGS
mmetsp:Transcript_114499/g.160750  ORF Transcript_114499/g.160750 Transcript_114499/m.160750 type:complete len:433 (-) Transcript_114499:82-1380(-)